jgi:D-threo-aldose 1-dehydrogenase
MSAAARVRRLELGRLGVGTAQLGNLQHEMSDRTAIDIVDAAWEAGIRYFDTAPHYGVGLSERRLGMALAGRPRDDFIVSTKVGRLLVPNPGGEGEQDEHGFRTPAVLRREWDFSRDGILRSIDDSLTRLGLDDVDIAYLHDPDDHWLQASTDGIGALIELRDQGVLRAIGVGMNQSAMLAEFVRRCDIDLVMVAGRHTLLDRTAADALLPLADERGVGVVAAAVYNSGLLSTATIAPDATFDYVTAPPEIVERAREMASLCLAYGVTLPAAAVQFPLRSPAVSAVVVGVRSRQEVEETIRRAAVPIPDELWTELDELAAGDTRSDQLPNTSHV